MSDFIKINICTSILLWTGLKKKTKTTSLFKNFVLKKLRKLEKSVKINFKTKTLMAGFCVPFWGVKSFQKGVSWVWH